MTDAYQCSGCLRLQKQLDEATDMWELAADMCRDHDRKMAEKDKEIEALRAEMAHLRMRNRHLTTKLQILEAELDSIDDVERIEIVEEENVLDTADLLVDLTEARVA